MRKKKPEEHVNHERWLVSYADFITLLFAFFTSLYAISTVDAQKMGKMVFSTRAAFDVNFFPSDKPVLGGSPPPVDQARNQQYRIDGTKSMNSLITPMQKEKLFDTPDKKISPQTVKELMQDLRIYIANAELEKMVRVKGTDKLLVVSLSEAAFFNSGESELRPESIHLLNSVGEKLLKFTLQIRVEGHTDNVPIHTDKFPSNWELSAARASTVVRHFIDEFAYPPDLLSAAGYASYRPIATNNTAEGRTQNRRIDIVLTDGSDDPYEQH
jgi:chemotaxis protein MotB